MERQPRGPNKNAQPVSQNQASFTITGEDLRNGFNSLRVAALTIDQQDMRAWDLISDVPVLPNLIAYVVLLLNIIIPGSGTILAACMAEKYMANKT